MRLSLFSFQTYSKQLASAAQIRRAYLQGRGRSHTESWLLLCLFPDVLPRRDGISNGTSVVCQRAQIYAE